MSRVLLRSGVAAYDFLAFARVLKSAFVPHIALTSGTVREVGLPVLGQLAQGFSR